MNKPMREKVSKGRKDEEVDEPVSLFKDDQDDKYEQERESEVSLSLSFTTPDSKTPSPSSGCALVQPKISKFFNMKASSGPRPAVPAHAAPSSRAQAQDGRDPAPATPKDKGPTEEKDLTAQLMAAAAAGDGPLIPASFVSFYEDPSRQGGFTPIYKHRDGSIYANFNMMASVNAGGGAINRSHPRLPPQCFAVLHCALALQ